MSTPGALSIDGTEIDPKQLTERLASVGQEHVLRYVDELDEDAKFRLLGQASVLPFDEIDELIATYVTASPEFELPSDVEPAPYFGAGDNAGWDRATAHEAGEDLIRAGKVAAFVVAGGQGSRLGYDGPKGCFPAGAVSRKPLFAFFAENLLEARDRYGVRIPWYIMTSPLNHDATVAFFREHQHFGLEASDLMFFPQGTMPSFDMNTGKILLAGKDQIATNPDGHGGSITALAHSGALADMRERGVEHLSYFQVDNPIIRILDPVFIGLHAQHEDSSSEVTSKMLPKAYPEEKVGLFCRSQDRTMVIEYSDMPAETQAETDENGQLRFLAGSIAIHMFGVEFLERIAGDKSFALPYHRAVKKVPHLDLETGQQVAPTEPNGIKLEKFVFDALPLAESSLVLETDRITEFAPIKNAEGTDSPASSGEIQTERAARWLERLGVHIARKDDGTPDCVIELSPRTATGPERLNPKDLPAAVEPGERIVL